VNDGALLFLQHMFSKMRAPQDGGSRLAIVFNGSPLFTGDAGGGESSIRQWIIENDWLEAIVALPEQLFYNTGISTYLWVLTNRKEKARKAKVQLIDARPFWVQMEKSLGNKRRRIGDPSDKEKDPDHIGKLTKLFGEFRDGQTRTFTEEDPVTHQPVERRRVVSKIFDNEDFGYHKITVERPLRLNFQASAERISRLDDESGFKNLATSAKKAPAAREKDIEAGRQRQQQIKAFLQRGMGVSPMSPKLYRDREAFLIHLRKSAKSADVRLSAPELKAVLAALGERDETAEICRDREGRPEPQSSIILYQTEDGRTRIQCRFENETIWLTQALIAELFQKDVRTINEHLVNIFDEGELSREATIRKFRIVRLEGGRQVTREVEHYRLEAILAVGYRVRSHRGTQFRQWATACLSEYLVKGFTMDDERLKNPPGKGHVDYFDEQLERIRDIRSSERRFYQKVLDIYATSVDYTPDTELTRQFFATVQNKMHWATHGQTAAEVIHARADAALPFMGLQTTRPGGIIRKEDVSVAKNYLNPEEYDRYRALLDSQPRRVDLDLERICTRCGRDPVACRPHD
jgi:hypothetical protein